MALSDDILLLRKKSQLTQGEVAEKAGISQGDLSNIEQGKTDSRLSTLTALASALGATVMLIPNEHRLTVHSMIAFDETQSAEPKTPLEQYGIPDDEEEN